MPNHLSPFFPPSSYRVLPSTEHPSTSSGSRSYSISLPPTPVGGAVGVSASPLPPLPTSRKQTWSGSGSSAVPSKRRTAGKFPPPPTGIATPSRVTRSNTGRNKPEMPVRVTRSNTAPLPLPPAASEGEVVDGGASPKEKKAPRLSPLHQALQDSVNFAMGKDRV